MLTSEYLPGEISAVGPVSGLILSAARFCPGDDLISQCDLIGGFGSGVKPNPGGVYGFYSGDILVVQCRNFNGDHVF